MKANQFLQGFPATIHEPEEETKTDHILDELKKVELEIIEILDDNRDGEISFNEFLSNIDGVNKFLEDIAEKVKSKDSA